MAKLSTIIPIKEGRTNSAQKELREYYLKGWKLVGCTSYYLVIEKDVDYDSIICLEEYNNAAQKSNMPLIYIVGKNGLYGIIDEYGIEIIPCTYIDCDYRNTLSSPEHCNIIIFYTETENYNFNRCTLKMKSYNMQDIEEQLENIRLKYEEKTKMEE